MQSGSDMVSASGSQPTIQIFLGGTYYIENVSLVGFDDGLSTSKDLVANVVRTAKDFIGTSQSFWNTGTRCEAYGTLEDTYGGDVGC